MLDLLSYPQWVLWKFAPNGRKRPISPVNGLPASVTNPHHWGTFDAVLTTEKTFKADGIGFVFTRTDPFCGIDLDNCITGTGLTPLARNIVDTMHTYTEISPSRKGLKLIVRGQLQSARCRPGVEIYPSQRFFTITGWRWPDTPATCTERQKELDRLIAWIDGCTQAMPTALPRGGLPRAAANNAYGLSALEGELARLRAASPGDRNNMLNRVAFSLGTLVGAGELDERLTTVELWQAARAIGLDTAETRNTIRSGLRAGMQRPRLVEPPRRPD